MKSVLIVDDSFTVRMDLDEAFRAAGWATVLCASAAAARAALNNQSFDCAILDVQLHDANGIDLLREMKNDSVTAGTAVIMLAAEADIAECVRAISAGADDYAAKPYDRQRIVSQAEQLSLRHPQTATPQAATPVVLAVDNSHTYLDALAEQLAQDNYDVVLADSGAKALDQLKTRSVDCILLDMLMPGMSGQEVCRRLKTSPQWRSIPVIMITGREDREAISDSFSAGADDYVPKTGDFTVLRARLRAQIRRRQSEQEANRAREDVHKRDIEVAEAAAVRRQNAVLQGVNRLLGQSLKAPTLEALGETCLEVAQSITDSEMAFIGEIGPDGVFHDVAMSNLSWDACKMYDQSGHRKPSGSFQIHGIYGRVLVDARSLIVNDPANHPDRIGVPPGHPPLKSFLGVPLMEQGVVTGMVAVGNRPGGYRQEDMESLEILAPAIVEAMARKRAEEALKRTAAELVRSNTDLEQFAYVASHDLQEPLRMISGFLDLLRSKYKGQLDPKADEWIDFSTDGASRMQGMIHDLLQYSRVGTRGKEPTAVDLSSVVDYVKANLRKTIEDSGAVITADQMPTVLADAAQMRQLFQNLIGNALKFRVEGRRPEVHIGARPEADSWVYYVRDNGIGIDPDHTDRIFKLFQRLHKRDTYAGSGIGLAICKKIVERHGGRIWVESQPDQGATFCFTLPTEIA